MLGRTILRANQLFYRPSRALSTKMSSIPHDVRMFLNGYPGLEDNPRQNMNLQFYSNKRRCQPDNMLLSEIHEE